MGTGGKFEAKSLVGLTLDQFEVKSEIARGGMGVVYKGYQPSLDRWVAIKTLPIDLAGDRELVSRFQREAKAMAALNHNNIVQCIHSGESAGQYYIAMEYVEGPSVKDLLKSPTIETDKIFDILAQTCDGLEYAHKKGLVHRDIKPANLLYEEKTGCVKIADFGIAHFSKKDEDMLTLTADNVGMGTMNYMAPEQKINAKGVDHRADIYALGVIVYEAFTGKLPLGKFKLPSEVNPKLPSALDDVVTRCLSTEPADRFGSCSEVKNVLLDAKAATNDKSIRRSMRDAIDRTLTAVLPNKTARYAFVGCFFVAIVAAVVGFGGFMIFRASKGKTRDALVVQVAAAKEAADKAAAGGPLGEGAKMKLSDGEAAIKKADEASQKKDVDAQIGELRKALDAYSSAVEAVNRDKAERAGQDKARLEEQAKELAKKVDARKAEVDALPDDGFKTAALAAIEDARKAQTAKDQDAVAKALTAAAQQVSNSKTTDENVASLRKSAESLKEKKAEGDKLVEDVLALRKKGEIEAINAAVEAARTKLKELGGQEAEIKKPPIEKTPDKTPDKTPETNPTASEDPKLVAASANAEEGARDARKQAKDVVDYASKLALEAGKAERAQAEEAFESVPGKPLAQRAAAYDEARKKFDGARDAALKGIQDALATAKADASSAKELAAEAWHDAEKAASDSETALEPARKAALLGEAVLKYRVAGNQANAAAKEKALKVRATAEAARADAVRRVGDKHSSLAPGDDLLAKGAAAKPADALALYEQAAAAFGGADFGPPKRLGFEATATSKRMVFIKDCADVIAGCPTGFVIAKALTITLYGNDLTQRTSMQAQSIVRALATGDGDEVFVAQGVQKPTIVRVIAGTSTLGPGKPLPGALGQPLDESVWALAYHRPTRRLFVATGERKILVFSTVDGSRQSEIATGIAGLAPPISLAVLRGGSVAVSGVANAPAADFDKMGENDWRFEVRRFRFDEGSGAWSAAGKPVSNQSAAVAASGDTLLGTTHEPEGAIQRFPGAASLSDAPTILPIESGLAAGVVKPKLGLKLAVYGHNLYLLDQAPGPDEQNFTVRPAAVCRKRVKIYELKED